MRPRDAGAAHRTSSNLELIFDLTFVVAVAKVANELAGALAAGHLRHGFEGYLGVFFAIWWAWMNFSWFASAFDTDDVPYRLLTLVQMAGVLVLAAGIPDAVGTFNFVGMTIGYVIMRVAMVCQWLRAAFSDPDHRRTCLRYAAGISVAEIGWVARLALPASLGFSSFLVLAVVEVAAPFWAERDGMTSWHPEHIAERYGLFTIIVLGEGIAQISGAFDGAFTAHDVTPGLAGAAVTGLVLLFALWWLYFAQPVGDGLREHPRRSFLWGYGHLAVFAALAAVAAALEVAIVTLRANVGGPEVHLSDRGVALTTAIPVAVFLVVWAALTAGVNSDRILPLAHVAAAALCTVVFAFAVPVVTLPVTLVLITLPSVVLVADNMLVTYRSATRNPGPAATEPPR